MHVIAPVADQQTAMRRYYRFHAAIYDATRWTFLFGRNLILRLLSNHPELTLAEVGCGTGRNLRRLAATRPDWLLLGIDVSPEMLRRAGKRLASFSRRLRLFEKPYGAGQFHLPEPTDLVLFSYALTMFNPGWEAAIEQARQDLKPGGRIAVVDFHDTPFAWFRRWMGYNHVRMEQHLLPVLEEHFETKTRIVRKAWGGLWRYFIFIGEKPLFHG
ncbi:MAG: class I SAM-dependent methyltransferase [Saprospiraceae bacterium]|jgi:S-adenosylmethionine-diacylgycerolhomoserine-N-methlytransferase|nr:class I SAM-dependent methyltransferase [Saprospiraceae bacterium]